MTAITVTEARKNLFGLVQKVNDDRVPIEIVSKHGNAVLMSKEDYDSWQETLYLLRNPVGAARLLDALQRVRRGEVEYHELIDA